MVLTQRHPNAHGLHKALAQIQPIRIFGLSGTIALNVAALMLLLTPSAPPLQVVKEEIMDIVTIEPTKPLPPPPPPVVKVEKPQPRTDTTQPIRQQVQPQQQQVDIIVPDGSEYVEKIDPVLPPAIDPPPPTGGAQPSASLQYASAPPPTYPREALLDGIEGTVLLKVLVDVDGTPLSVDIERSSGNRKLDEAARRQVMRKWKFKPALRDGQAIQVYGMVPVDFSLTRQ